MHRNVDKSIYNDIQMSTNVCRIRQNWPKFPHKSIDKWA